MIFCKKCTNIIGKLSKSFFFGREEGNGFNKQEIITMATKLSTGVLAAFQLAANLADIFLNPAQYDAQRRPGR